MERTELVALLGVTADPTTGQVRQASRSLARRLHPDTAGQDSATTMAEVNAAIDEWLAQIRSRRNAPTPASAARATAPAPPRGTPPEAQVPLRMAHAAATVVLIIVVALVVVALIGFSTMSLATGALLGSGAAGIFAVLVHRHERHARPH